MVSNEAGTGVPRLVRNTRCRQETERFRSIYPRASRVGMVQSLLAASRSFPVVVSESGRWEICVSALGLGRGNRVNSSAAQCRSNIGKHVLIGEEANRVHSAFLRRAVAACTVASSSAAKLASISSRYSSARQLRLPSAAKLCDNISMLPTPGSSPCASLTSIAPAASAET